MSIIKTTLCIDRTAPDNNMQIKTISLKYLLSTYYNTTQIKTMKKSIDIESQTKAEWKMPNSNQVVTVFYQKKTAICLKNAN